MTSSNDFDSYDIYEDVEDTENSDSKKSSESFNEDKAKNLVIDNFDTEIKEIKEGLNI